MGLIRNYLASGVLGATLLSSSAQALPYSMSCEDRLAQSTIVVKLELVLLALEKLELNSLLHISHNQKLDVEFQQRGPWRNQNVAWKKGLLGGRILIVRDLPWKTEADRERSTWDVAVALYQMQVERRWYVYRAIRVADLDADMRKLAESFTAINRNELGTKTVERYLYRAKRLAIAMLIGAGVQFGIQQIFPSPTALDTPVMEFSPEVQRHILAEKSRLEKLGLKDELHQLCVTFPDVTKCGPGM